MYRNEILKVKHTFHIIRRGFIKHLISHILCACMCVNHPCGMHTCTPKPTSFSGELWFHPRMNSVYLKIKWPSLEKLEEYRSLIASHHLTLEIGLGWGRDHVWFESSHWKKKQMTSVLKWMEIRPFCACCVMICSVWLLPWQYNCRLGVYKYMAN